MAPWPAVTTIMNLALRSHSLPTQQHTAAVAPLAVPHLNPVDTWQSHTQTKEQLLAQQYQESRSCSPPVVTYELHPSCSSTTLHTPNSSPATPIIEEEQSAASSMQYPCSSPSLHHQTSLSASSSVSASPIDEEETAPVDDGTDQYEYDQLSSPPVHPVARLRRSGPGGFYERDISASSSRSLADLMHDSNQQSTESDSTTLKSHRLTSHSSADQTAFMQFPMSPDEEAEINAYFTNDDEAQQLVAPQQSPASSIEEEVEQPMQQEVKSEKQVEAPITVDAVKETLALEEQKLAQEALEKVERERILEVLACTLEQLCPESAALPSDPHFLSLFHTSSLPGISIRDYLLRLAMYTGVSNECMIQALIHIRTLARNGQAEVDGVVAPNKTSSASPVMSPSTSMNDDLHSVASSASSSSSSSVSSTAPLLQSAHPRINSFSSQPFLVSAYNIHRLLLTAMLTSAKFIDDQFYNNRIYSNLGGISLKELNRLEYEFLNLLEYRMFISSDQFIREYDDMNLSVRGIGPTIVVHPEDEYTMLDDEVVDEEVSVAEVLNVQAVRITEVRITNEDAMETQSMFLHQHVQQQHQQNDDSMCDVSHSVASSTATTPVHYSSIPTNNTPCADVHLRQHHHQYRSESVPPEEEHPFETRLSVVYAHPYNKIVPYQQQHQQHHQHLHHHASKYPYESKQSLYSHQQQDAYAMME